MADVVLMLAQAGLTISVVPMILRRVRPGTDVAGVTAACLWFTVGAYVSLRIELAAAMTTISAVLWTVLLIQGARHA